MKVYTYNDKVLVNSANDKWLKESPSVLYYSVILDYTDVNTNGNSIAIAYSISPTPTSKNPNVNYNFYNPTGQILEMQFNANVTVISFTTGSTTDNKGPLVKLYKVTTEGNELLDQVQAGQYGASITFNIQ